MRFIRHIPRRALMRFVLLVVLVAGAAAIVRFTPLGDHFTKDAIVALIDRLGDVWWSPILLVALYVVFSPLGLPATPLMIAGALVFGARYGSLYNFLGALAGATSTYFVAKALGADLVHHFVGNKLRPVERRLARRGFFTLISTRFLPLPFPVVNFAMAFAGIRPMTFLASTAIGLAPSIIVWTHFYASLFAAAAGERAGLVKQLFLILFLLGFVTLLPGLIQRRLRLRRLRRIQRTRSARPTPAPPRPPAGR
ncbi:MAG TPA: VTT domain-containing protein [Thermoanaerobaculia bacterium]|nr:VTT domain-containing protein [Thermoanaerobaculia bacterium]